MLQKWIVTGGAGLASMLLFLVSAKGSVAATIVTYFTPLPLMIATLGWGPVAGFIAALVAAGVLTLALGPIFGAIHGLAFGLPSWWLGHLALLARFETGAAPATPKASPQTKPQTTSDVQRRWYPIGRLVVWAAVAAAVPVLVGLLVFGILGPGHEARVQDAATRLAPVLADVFGGARLPQGLTADAVARVAVRILPAAATASLTLLLLANLWCAARTVELSGRLARPWPAIPESLRLPRFVAAVFPVVVLLALLLHGATGLIAGLVAAVAAMLLALQGLAVIHAVSRGRAGRVGLLMALYAATILLMPWSLLGCLGIGVAESVFALRERRANRPLFPPRS